MLRSGSILRTRRRRRALNCSHQSARTVAAGGTMAVRPGGSTWTVAGAMPANHVMILLHLASLVTSAPAVSIATAVVNVSYHGFLKLYGEERRETLKEAGNYVTSLLTLNHFEEARLILRKTIPVARRVLGKCDIASLRMRWSYARALYQADGATLDDLREAVTTLEDTARIARRVLGLSHPTVVGIEQSQKNARIALRARDSA